MRQNNFILTEAEDVAYMYDEIEDFVEKYGIAKMVEVLSEFLKDHEKRQKNKTQMLHGR